MQYFIQGDPSPLSLVVTIDSASWQGENLAVIEGVASSVTRYSLVETLI
jgi:hypothetical protein